MNTLDVPLSGSAKVSQIEEAAIKFVASPKTFKLLERHRSAVLLLRARDASYSQIQSLLSEHHVLVSESSIVRFCRKHGAEIKRQRLLLEQEVNMLIEPALKPAATSPSAFPTVSTNPPQPSTRKIRDLRGEV